MRRYHLPLFAALFLAASTRLLAPATAADFRAADEFTLKADETIDDDLYVCAKTIRIDGTVDGDVIGWAQEITINGTVKGSLIVGGQTVVLNGSASSARLGGQASSSAPKQSSKAICWPAAKVLNAIAKAPSAAIWSSPAIKPCSLEWLATTCAARR